MLSDRELSHVCMTRLRNSDTFTQKIQQNRKQALDAYMTEKQGDEIDGQSQFVTSDVRDTVEWIMPSLLELFIGEESPATFSPKNADDVEAAKRETAYIQDVLFNQNEGFLLLYTWLKDGLLSKNGVIKSYWDERVDEIQETYRDRTYPDYMQIMSDDAIEVERVTIKIGEEELSLEDAEEYGGVEGLLMSFPMALFDIDAVRKENNSQVQTDNVPPENIFVDKDHPSLDLDEASFVCHRETLTASDLLVDGYPKDLVDSIPAGSYDDFNEERVNRFEDDGSVTQDFFEDHAQKEVNVLEFYIRIDADGDGKSELRMIKLAGPNGSVLLDNEVVDSIPFSVWTPIISPHKHYGLSIYDIVGEIQKLKTAVMRGMLDNIYLTNNPIKTVNPNLTEMQDVLEAGPGAIWRVDSPDAVTTHVTPFMGEASIGVLGLIDKMREERTGVSGTTQGLNPDALSDSTNMVGTQIMSQALQRVKMIARIFAETGFKHLVLRLHELCMKYDKQDREFQYEGQFSTIHPREWTKRKELKIKVGVGHADKMQKLQAAGIILQNHEKIVASGGLGGPLLTKENVYTALIEQAKLLGYPDAAKFYRDPATYQPPPPENPMSELIEVETAKATLDAQKKAADNAITMKKHNDDLVMKKAEMEQKRKEHKEDLILKKQELSLKYGKDLRDAKAQRSEG